jgi:hypothetical protein
MLETEIQIFDIFYRIEISKDAKYDSGDLLDWLNSIGSSVNYMRSTDWINAKKYASKAFEFSNKESIENIKKDEYLGGAIKIHQKDTKRYFEEAKKHPVEIAAPEDRFDLMIELQSYLIELMEKYYLEKPDRILSDVILYPIEKLGVAISYLMDSNVKIERANYEIGLACEHFKEKIANLQEKEKQEWAASIYQKLEFMFSKLPAEPWPVEGLGEPDVESRFRK